MHTIIFWRLKSYLALLSQMGSLSLTLALMIFITASWSESVLHLDMSFVVAGGSSFLIFNGCELFEAESVSTIVKVVMPSVPSLFRIYQLRRCSFDPDYRSTCPKHLRLGWCGSWVFLERLMYYFWPTLHYSQKQNLELPLSCSRSWKAAHEHYLSSVAWTISHTPVHFCKSLGESIIYSTLSAICSMAVKSRLCYIFFISSFLQL